MKNVAWTMTWAAVLSLGAAHAVACGGATSNGGTGETSPGAGGNNGVGGSGTGGTGIAGTGAGGKAGGTSTGGTGVSGAGGGSAGTGVAGTAGSGGGSAGTAAKGGASGTGGSGTAGTGTAGSGTAGSGTAGSGTAGSGTAGSGGAAMCPDVPPNGGFCADEGLNCPYGSPGCGPICFCSNHQWQCALPGGPPCFECTTPAVMGASCPAIGATCADACNQECTCKGVWACPKACSTCVQGAMCAAGDACQSKNGNCTTECKCDTNGTYECATGCQACQAPPPACGSACSPSSIGATCSCADGQGNTTSCTCTPGGTPQPLWECQPSSPCGPGSKCTPGDQCTLPEMNGCSLVCSCTANGVYDCTDSCAGQCPSPAPSVGSACSVIGASCQCQTSPSGPSVPCTCDGKTWVAGAPGCPATMPTPGSACSDMSLQCPYGAFAVCFCTAMGWECAL